MQNGATLETLQKFENNNYPSKFIFTSKLYPQYKSTVLYKCSSSNDSTIDEVKDDITKYNKYINLVEWINSSYK